MSKFLLGLDIGTTGTKVGLFNINGKQITAKRYGYKTYHPQEGYAEQNPEDWWDSVKTGIKEIIREEGINPGDIKAIGVDSMTPSMLPLTEDGKVLYPAIIWSDKRAKKECNQITHIIGRDEIIKITGNNVKLNLLAPKLLWFKENKPELFKKTDVFLQPNGYINYKLTGTFSMDISNSELTLLADMNTGKWKEELFDRLGIPLTKMPKIVECTEIIGSVSRKASQETSLIEGIPVIGGGNDTAVSFFSLNVIEPGEASLELGHAANLGMCLREPKSCDISDLYHHVLPDRWILQIYTATAGAALRWFKEEFAEFESRAAELVNFNPYKFLDREAEKVEPGCSGLILLPYLEGAQFAPEARGIISGVTTSTTRAQVLRALLEGCAMAVRRNMEEIESVSGREISKIYLGGGGSNSRLWSQIHADILGKEILVPRVKDAAILGSALLAGIGTGVLSESLDIKSIVPIEGSYLPDKENQVLYNETFERYCFLLNNYNNRLN